ncbi:MAG: antibiotic biosynthesis monooxygenase [Chloroflexota bacterium]|nr:antibiotic biosynthesis monooxygenase [Chloroflexota bacterium]
MAEHAHIVRVARYRPQPGAVEELRAALRALAEGMRGMPGLFGVQVCRLMEDPEWLALISRWEHEQAMQGTGDRSIEELVTRVAGLGQEQRVEHFIAD